MAPKTVAEAAREGTAELCSDDELILGISSRKVVSWGIFFVQNNSRFRIAFYAGFGNADSRKFCSVGFTFPDHYFQWTKISAGIEKYHGIRELNCTKNPAQREREGHLTNKNQ